MAKTVNFGVLYGMSAAGLSTRLSIPRKEAEEFIDHYFARYPRVLDYQQRLLAGAHEKGEVGTLLGRKRSFNRNAINPRSHYKMRGQAEREAINMEIQGSAADLMKKAMLAVHARLAAEKRQAKILLTVHDELVFEAPPGEVAAVARIAREEMTGALKLDVDLKVDVAAGPNWLEVGDV
jgi:DNA polymerase-1